MMEVTSKHKGSKPKQQDSANETRRRSIAPGKLVQRVAPYLGGLALLTGLKLSGVGQSLDLLLYDLVTTLRPAASGKP